ncbi:hypothetical protein PAL_GLEAN10023191 [Pteropus alecto]|uniref:Uncharacterized protein n=1 Tax=Pteropus alecto TaxID=9402 RepID=L5K5G5_PTEAL|nr:hypothetical protein PAL_GLEAN10023191 [Pteropus alecto]
MRKGRGNRPQKAGERAGGGSTAACRYGAARLRKLTKTTAYSSAPAWLPEAHGGLCSSLSENAGRIPLSGVGSRRASGVFSGPPPQAGSAGRGLCRASVHRSSQSLVVSCRAPRVLVLATVSGAHPPARDIPWAALVPHPLPPRARGQTLRQAARAGRAGGCGSCQGGRGEPGRMKPAWGNAWPEEVAGSLALRHPDDFTHLVPLTARRPGCQLLAWQAQSID